MSSLIKKTPKPVELEKIYYTSAMTKSALTINAAKLSEEVIVEGNIESEIPVIQISSRNMEPSS